jgi:DNA primase
MPGIDYRELRRRLKIAGVLELAKFKPAWRWQEQVRGPCPLHGSHSARTRSFAAHLGKNVYRCFACGAQGNALELWVALTGQGLHRAALDLCERLHLEVPWLGQRG